MRREPISPKALAAALMLLLAGCTSASKPAAPAAASIVGPVWVAEDIAGAAAGGAAPITLQLGTDGRASGRGGCNGYGGAYTLTGDALSFGPLLSTKMACAPALMDREQRYFQTLAQTAHYAVADDGALLLTTADGKTIRFRRQ
ncbi:MAG TPA: META domain-containing protein [Methylomirabilota bacterium]|nr:META domain-containing protein [Methylomirabilota bacterium]